MLYIKSVSSAVTGFAFVLVAHLIPGVSAADDAKSLSDPHLMLAQAQEHHKMGGHYNKGDKHNHGQKNTGGGGHHDYAHMIIFNADTLKLSNEQLGEIVRLHLKHKKEHKQLKASIKENMMAFKKETTTLGSSDNQLKKRGEAFAGALDAMINFHVQERKALHAILTAEQIKQLDTIKIDHHSHSHSGGHGH